MLCGAFLGISVIAPGISGSIMAVMMGIYDDLINIISNPFKKFKKNFAFLLPMGIGAVVCIVLLVKVLDFMFDNYAVPSYLLFMSLILGSIPSVIDEAREEPIKKKYFIGTVLAFSFALTIGILAKSEAVIPIDTTDITSVSMKIYLPVCGAVAGMMSMVPGMSISMLLMMFGIYEPLLNLATNLMKVDRFFTEVWFGEALTAGTVVIAFIVGMVLFSNVTKTVFKKHHSLGFLMVLGFMSGSVISIFPGLPSGWINWILSVVAIAIGLSISYLFKILGKKFNVEE